jgi:hypothetical protein
MLALGTIQDFTNQRRIAFLVKNLHTFIPCVIFAKILRHLSRKIPKYGLEPKSSHESRVPEMFSKD